MLSDEPIERGQILCVDNLSMVTSWPCKRDLRQIVAAASTNREYEEYLKVSLFP